MDIDVGKRIRDLRVAAGLTQKQLAHRLYVTAQAVSRWEQNLVEPNLQTINQMASIFHVSVDHLLGRADEETPVNPTSKEIEAMLDQKLAAQKRTIGVCDRCHRPILEGEPMHVENLGDGNKTVYCDACQKKKEAEDKARVERNNTKWRRLAWTLFGLGIGVALVITIVLGVMMPKSAGLIFGVGIPLSILLGMLLYCIAARNTNFSDIYLEIISWGCVKFPGLIFRMDIEGIVWVILMKILFWFLGIIISIGAFTLATGICAVLSIFFFPIAVKRSYTRPEKTEMY